jgi:hypothetical protein
MVADVQLALARKDADDSAVSVNLLLTPIDHRRTELLRHWVFLGAAYSLVASALPMRYLALSIISLHKKRPG